MISDLYHNNISDRQATVVMDAGIAIEDNIDYLKEHNLPYLVVSRKAHREFDETGAVVVKDDADFTVTVQKVHDPDTGETLIILPLQPA